MVEAFYPVLTEGGVMINFPPSLMARTNGRRGRGGEFFRAGLAYAMSKKFVIYFTQKNVARFAEKARAASCRSRPAAISRPCTRSSSTISRKRRSGGVVTDIPVMLPADEFGFGRTSKLLTSP